MSEFNFVLVSPDVSFPRTTLVPYLKSCDCGRRFFGRGDLCPSCFVVESLK